MAEIEYTKQFKQRFMKANPPEWQIIGKATIEAEGKSYTIGTIWQNAQGEIFIKTTPSIHGAGQKIKLNFKKEEEKWEE